MRQLADNSQRQKIYACSRHETQSSDPQDRVHIAEEDRHGTEPQTLPSSRVCLALCLLFIAVADGSALAVDKSSIAGFNTVTSVSTTVPANGDLNPYGVARVPRTKGSLVEGRFLISNFNNGANQQGTGTTIVQIAPNGTFSLFAQIDANKVSCPGGIGLTTALVALRSGLVVVGSLPTMGGDPTTSEAGCLIVLDSKGNVIKTFSGHHINGPWDMTAVDGGPFAALVCDQRAEWHGRCKGRRRERRNGCPSAP